MVTRGGSRLRQRTEWRVTRDMDSCGFLVSPCGRPGLPKTFLRSRGHSAIEFTFVPELSGHVPLAPWWEFLPAEADLAMIAKLISARTGNR